MRTTIKRSSDGTQVQLVLEAQNKQEDEDLDTLYHRGSIVARGETDRQRVQLILGTGPVI